MPACRGQGRKDMSMPTMCMTLICVLSKFRAGFFSTPSTRGLLAWWCPIHNSPSTRLALPHPALALLPVVCSAIPFFVECFTGRCSMRHDLNTKSVRREGRSWGFKVHIGMVLGFWSLIPFLNRMIRIFFDALCWGEGRGSWLMGWGDFWREGEGGMGEPLQWGWGISNFHFTREGYQNN